MSDDEIHDRLPHRSVVPAPDPRHRRHGGRDRAPTACPPTRRRVAPAQGDGLFRRAARPSSTGRRADDVRGAAPRRSACGRCSSASTPAPPSSPRRRPTCIRPTRRRSPASAVDEARRRPTSKKVDHPRRRPEPHRPGHRVRLLLLPRRLRARTRPASRPSWSTATRRPCRPTTTPPTGSISSR